jgi:integrase
MADPKDAKSIERGLYRTPSGVFFERLTLNGKRTWRRLYSRTLKDAREEMSAKRADHGRSKLGLARDPYVRIHTVKEVLDRYLADGTPDRRGRPRPDRTALDERRRMPRLLEAFGTLKVTDLSFPRLKSFGEQRGSSRAADLDLYTLNNALEHARVSGLISANPIREGRPQFHDRKKTRNCRETAPLSGDELHELAAELFAKKRSERLGWQLLIEAFTGCRTSEVLRFRMDAKNREDAGFIEGDWLWLKRSKNGTNPFALIHPALRECIEAHHKWHAENWPGHPYWFPHQYDRNAPVDGNALNHALQRIAKSKGLGPRTSHGLRAFFVTVRRSQGISDGQIAAEIGDKTGAAIIASTYGAIPPNWQGGVEMNWLPSSGQPVWT